MFLCPISFGLALGITWFIAMIIAGAWMMYHGIPAALATTFPGPITWTETFVMGLMGLVKGFIFGIVLALFYDMFICLKHGCRHKHDMVGGKCACGPACKCVGDCKCCSNSNMSPRDMDMR